MRLSPSNRRPAPVWRSLLFVPANVDRFIDGASERGADAIVLDLEDSVLPADKAAARARVPEAALKVGRRGADVLVRINAPLRQAVRDIEASVCREVRCLMLPKVDSAEQLRLLAGVLDEVERERGLEAGHTQLFPLIESCEAYFHMRAIAAAHPRVVALSVGSEDFSASAGMAADGQALLLPKQEMVFAARAAGVLPLGYIGSVANLDASQDLLALARRACALGSTGAMTVHPRQVPLLNEAFSPSPDELAAAERVIAAFDLSAAQGQGALQLDGRMVDIAVVERARAVLARQAAIRAAALRRA